MPRKRVLGLGTALHVSLPSIAVSLCAGQILTGILALAVHVRPAR
jgi:hypothetical protein